MALLRLDIADFRNLSAVRWQPLANGFNLIYGNNGSGKTSLLEAIYYLSLGRSFRSTVLNRVISNSAEKFSLFAHLGAENQLITPVGIERYQNGETKIRIFGKDVRGAAELASLTPVQLINSNCYNLLDAPGFRRKYLDWGVFYASSEFLPIWRSFERALKQRNAALRGQLPHYELSIWTQELIEHALHFHRIREEYVQNLMPFLTQAIHELLPFSLFLYDFKIQYHPGWPIGNEGIAYSDILTESLIRDRQLGHTQYGPHRADFKIIINQRPAKDILSRGQQKLFVCAMILAQGALLNSVANKRPIYLVDDLPSELDATSRSLLLSLLSKQQTQIFVTTVERETLDGFLTQYPTKMFHVEHGSVLLTADDQECKV